MKPAQSTKNKRQDKQTGFVYWRFSLLCVCVFFAMFALISRAAWLQVIYPDKLIREGDMRSLRTQTIPTTRGIITDRTGRPLAVSVPAYAICANPQRVSTALLLEDENGRGQALADVLGMTLEQLVTRLNTSAEAKSSFIYLTRQTTPEIADYIRALKLPGICWEQESRRFYPASETTAHIIGFTNIDGQGIEGIEKSFDEWLTGQAGERTVRKDRLGRVIEDISFVDSKMPHNLTLSIDERLQSLVYSELNKAVELNKAISGTVVLVDVNTGEVLAMVNSPSYNPNNREGTSNATFRNRAITDMFEPGSTVKPMVVMTALDKGIVKDNTVMNTRPYIVNGKEIKDVAPRNELSITGIIQKSSNVGVSRLALEMPPSALVETYSKFGFGKPTNLGLIGESRGMFPGASKTRWADIERATFSFGYGLMVTPLQLARVYATIGSGGIYRPLSITKVDPPVIGERVFPEKTVRRVIEMMETVALPGEGGARAAVKGYNVAVKTGTAKKIGPHGGYVDKYIAYTAGIAPASNPRFALVVVIDEPSAGKIYGGAVSAPVFSSIMGGVLRTMNVKPDALPDDMNAAVKKK